MKRWKRSSEREFTPAQGRRGAGKADKELEHPRATHKKKGGGKYERWEMETKEGKGEEENEKYGERKEEKG